MSFISSRKNYKNSSEENDSNEVDGIVMPMVAMVEILVGQYVTKYLCKQLCRTS